MTTVGQLAGLTPSPGAVPSGGIIMFTGYTAPTGWQVCNGSNGAPDLRGKFVMATDSPDGVTGSYKIADTGGATTATTGTGGSHNHTGATQAGGDHTHTYSFSGTSGSTSLTTAQLPSHAHKQYWRSTCGDQDDGGGAAGTGIGTFILNPAGGTCPRGGGAYGSLPDLYTGSGDAHSHSISGSGTTSSPGTHTHTIGTDGSHTHTVSVLPPYYVLAFIMKL